jgi:hypothetical protein
MLPIQIKLPTTNPNVPEYARRSGGNTRAAVLLDVRQAQDGRWVAVVAAVGKDGTPYGSVAVVELADVLVTEPFTVANLKG